MTILAKAPVREEFAGRSTGTGGSYYATKGDAIESFDIVLQNHNLQFDLTELSDFPGNEGRKMVSVLDEFNAPVGSAVLAWYRMPSGRYEFTGYLA